MHTAPTLCALCPGSLYVTSESKHCEHLQTERRRNSKKKNREMEKIPRCTNKVHRYQRKNNDQLEIFLKYNECASRDVYWWFHAKQKKKWEKKHRTQSALEWSYTILVRASIVRISNSKCFFVSFWEELYAPTFKFIIVIIVLWLNWKGLQKIRVFQLYKFKLIHQNGWKVHLLLSFHISFEITSFAFTLT